MQQKLHANALISASLARHCESTCSCEALKTHRVPSPLAFTRRGGSHKGRSASPALLHDAARLGDSYVGTLEETPSIPGGSPGWGDPQCRYDAPLRNAARLMGHN